MLFILTLTIIGAQKKTIVIMKHKLEGIQWMIEEYQTVQR